MDTRIVPQALWVTDEGLQQEQALWVVAAHDASALTDALCGTLGGQRMAAALLNWNRQTSSRPNSQPSTQQANKDTHTVVYPLNQLPTHAMLMKRYLDLLAPPVQKSAAIRQPQQAQQREQTELQPAQATIGQQRDGQKQQPRAEQLTQPAVTTRMPVMQQQQQPVEEQRQSQRQSQQQPQVLQQQQLMTKQRQQDVGGQQQRPKQLNVKRITPSCTLRNPSHRRKSLKGIARTKGIVCKKVLCVKGIMSRSIG